MHELSIMNNSQERREKIRSKISLLFGDLVTVKDQDFEVVIADSCFTEGSDSILGTFFAVLCEQSYKTSNKFLG